MPGRLAGCIRAIEMVPRLVAGNDVDARLGGVQPFVHRRDDDVIYIVERHPARAARLARERDPGVLGSPDGNPLLLRAARDLAQAGLPAARNPAHLPAVTLQGLLCQPEQTSPRDDLLRC